MSTKSNKIVYWISTGLLSALMLFSASMYFFNHETVVEAFTKLGFPTYLIYPLATVKVLGILAILTKASDFLKNLAYAGFFFNLILAASAHINAEDGEFPGAVMGLVFLFVSYRYSKKK